MSRRRYALAAGLWLLSGCSGLDRSARPLVQRLEAAPLPPGAVAVGSQARDGGFDQDPKASRDFEVPHPVVQTCALTLRGYLAAGYTVTESVVMAPGPEVSDPEHWCAAQWQAQTGPYPAVLAQVHAADADPKYPRDGFAVVFTPSKAAGTPDATHLSLQI